MTLEVNDKGSFKVNDIGASKFNDRHASKPNVELLNNPITIYTQIEKTARVNQLFGTKLKKCRNVLSQC